ncbi:MAG: DUF3604 domain-containing protein [bacterium]|nr:DUF3604 domain-containing protein [bacterium]
MKISKIIKKAGKYTGLLLLLILAAIVTGYFLIDPYTKTQKLSGEEQDGTGSVILRTSSWQAGTGGNSIKLDYLVGKGGLGANSGIKVNFGHILPVGKSPGARQMYIPFELTMVGFVFFDINFFLDPVVSSSNSSVRLSVQGPTKWEILKKYTGYVKHKRSEEGKSKRDNLMQSIDRETALKIIVEEGTLKEGDSIHITLGDTAQGPGITAPHRESKFDVMVQSDGNGNGTYDLVKEIPSFEVLVPKAETFNIVTKMNPDPGKPVDLIVAATDRCYLPNQVKKYTGTIQFSSNKTVKLLPQSYQFTPADNGIKRFRVIFPDRGLYRVTVKDDSGINAASHYIDTRAHTNKIYFGDIHVHTVLSYDAGREPEYVVNRRRDVDGLDFMSLTDHDLIGTAPMGGDRDSVQGMTSEEWDYIQRLSNKKNEPGKFVTLNGYEWTNYPHGHRNIIYDPAEEKLPHFCWAHKQTDTPAELVTALEDYSALIISHSPAWRTGMVAHNWGPRTRKQCLVEIYSTHGTSEYFDNPFAVDKGKKEIPVDNGLIKTILMYDIQQAPRGLGNFVQEALASGWKFGFIGSSDIHYLAYVDQAYKAGFAAVHSPALTRKDIYSSLHKRHTYATTGARIGLRFSCNGSPMGSEITIKGKPEFTGEVLGTAKITKIEIIKYNGSAYSAVHTTLPNTDRAAVSFIDNDFKGTAFYYLRVTQEDGNMAWGSPIWIAEE